MKKIGILLIIYFCSISAAFSIRVTALYQGVVPVSSQSADARNQVASDALAQVLVKVSGNTNILNNPQIKERLNSASSLMQEFSYIPAPNIPGNTKPYFLQLHFDPNGVNKILRDVGAPLWGQNRPLVLALFDYEMPQRPAEIIGADSGSNISVMLKQNTDRRGIPIIFPAMDVEDLGQLSVNDIQTMNLPKLMNAAKRYMSDAVLIGRIMQDANGYNTQWKLVMGNDQWGWNISGKTLQDVLATLADRAGDTLGGRYATVITNTVQSNLTLKIINVAEADDFVQAMNYIKHLTPVSDVELIQITGSEMLLKVSLRGTEESFAKALSVGQKLTPAQNDSKSSVLVYQWNH